jgi:hypothetical protein
MLDQPKILLKLKMHVTNSIEGRLLNIYHQSSINQILKKIDNRQSGLKNKQVMRKISFVLVAAMLLSVGSVFANNNPKSKLEPSKGLSAQIGKLLSNNSFSTNDDGSTAQVLFMLNDDKEIVVLSVDTEKEDLEGFIKSRLNYQEVDLAGNEEGKKYTVSVRVVI